jgi:hypothetical protein
MFRVLGMYNFDPCIDSKKLLIGQKLLSIIFILCQEYSNKFHLMELIDLALVIVEWCG